MMLGTHYMKYPLNRSALEVFLAQTAAPLALTIIGALWQSDVLMIGGVITWGAAYFLWLVGVSRASNLRLAASLQRPTRGIEIGLAYAFVYLLVGWYPITHGSPGPWIFVPHLAAMAAIFYALWFSSRQLSTFRYGRYSFENTFSSFVLMWFFPIGVWVLQPIVQEKLGADGA